MRNPFLTTEQTVISVSGGRTSMMMLRKTLDAHGGTLPDWCKAVFANTGKEMLETLDFVNECSVRWNVPITWVEYRPKTESGKNHAIVTYETASRHGEPFEYVIDDRHYLPNVVARFCTAEMKIRTMHRVLKEEFGFTDWTSFVGLRADEPHRVARLRARSGAETKHEDPTCPMAEAGYTAKDVGEFWEAQPFDLMLPNMNGRTMHGNCDLCFLKGAGQVLALIRENPERAFWWMEMERKKLNEGSGASGATFRNDRPSYQAMYKMAINQGELFEFNEDDYVIECTGCTD